MKRWFAFAIGMFAAVSTLFAQHDVVTFWGIPVNGTVVEMHRNLLAKGFKPYRERDFQHLYGKLNGVEDVHVFIESMNDSVHRIVVYDQNFCSGTTIGNRFNSLCRQFDNDTDYVPFKENDTIAVDEDISHEYFNNQKRYVAKYHQKNPKKAGEKLIRGKVWFEIANYKDEFYITAYYENL